MDETLRTFLDELYADGVAHDARGLIGCGGGATLSRTPPCCSRGFCTSR